MPAEASQQSLFTQAKHLFEHNHLKSIFFVDAYFSVLGQAIDSRQIQTITYWYSMWSHRRDGLWKGFIQVDLDPAQDQEARMLLDERRRSLS